MLVIFNCRATKYNLYPLVASSGISINIMRSNYVSNFQLQSNKVQSSNHMEKEGLARALEFLTGNSLQVKTLITNRHKQISKFVSKQYSEIVHR